MINVHDITIEHIASHRNGVCGIGFYVVLFPWFDIVQMRRMRATVFPMPGAQEMKELGAGDVAAHAGRAYGPQESAPDASTVREELARHVSPLMARGVAVPAVLMAPPRNTPVTVPVVWAGSEGAVTAWPSTTDGAGRIGDAGGRITTPTPYTQSAPSTSRALSPAKIGTNDDA